MDQKLIAEATAAIELIDIHLYTCSLERRDCEFDIFSVKKDQKNSVKVNAEIFEPAEEKEGYFQLLNIKVSLKAELYTQEDHENSIYSISACFLAKYLQRYEVSEDALNEFIQYNSLHNVWPFWREHALRTASLADLPRPQINLMKHGALKPKKKNT